MNQQQMLEYMQAIANTGITPNQLESFLKRAALQLERGALDSALSNLEIERKTKMAEIDDRRNGLIAMRDAKQQEIDAL